MQVRIHCGQVEKLFKQAGQHPVLIQLLIMVTFCFSGQPSVTMLTYGVKLVLKEYWSIVQIFNNNFCDCQSNTLFVLCHLICLAVSAVNNHDNNYVIMPLCNYPLNGKMAALVGIQTKQTTLCPKRGLTFTLNQPFSPWEHDVLGTRFPPSSMGLPVSKIQISNWPASMKWTVCGSDQSIFAKEKGMWLRDLHSLQCLINYTVHLFMPF